MWVFGAFWIGLIIGLSIPDEGAGPPDPDTAAAVAAPEQNSTASVALSPTATPRPTATLVGSEIETRTYRLADTKDSSFGNVRSRATLEIEAPAAITEQAQIETMMKAAVDHHRQAWPDAISVRLWESYGAGANAINRIVYAADGCGWTGDACTDVLWTELLRGDIPQQLRAWGAPSTE